MAENRPEGITSIYDVKLHIILTLRLQGFE
jgi:hypothetical protein